MGVPHYSTIALLLCAFLALMPLLYAETFETGDNSTVDGCSYVLDLDTALMFLMMHPIFFRNHCTYHDTSISCWNKTLYVFSM
jgi:hypothetical protein